jgi:hypothetical protein
MTALATARPRPAIGPASILAGPALLVATRIGLAIGLQLLLSGIVLVAGVDRSRSPMNVVAGWWMAYASLVELGTLGVLLLLIRREGISYRSLLGPPARAWQLGLGAAAVLAASLPAVVFSATLNSAVYGEVTPPILAIVDLPPPASLLTVLVWPLLISLAEPVAYLGMILPRLERLTGKGAIAAVIVVAVWSAEHAVLPVLVSEGGIDLVFAATRVASVLPFMATWTALYYAFGRRLVPGMIGQGIFNGFTAIGIALGLVA